MVRSTPLLRKRIEHKRTARFTRFQSDLYGGRLAPSWRRPRGITQFNIQVSITEWEEDSEVINPCQKSVMETIKKLDSIYQMALKNSSFTIPEI